MLREPLQEMFTRMVEAKDITQAWVETPDRLAGRMWITTERPGEDATRIEVIFVALYRDRRIHRLWELTWPDWSQLQAFETYS
jgi:hypothetical protein